MGAVFPFRVMKEFWNHSGDGCTALRMYSMLPNCTLADG